MNEATQHTSHERENDRSLSDHDITREAGGWSMQWDADALADLPGISRLQAAHRETRERNDSNHANTR